MNKKKYVIWAVVFLVAAAVIAVAAILGSRLWESSEPEEPPLAEETEEPEVEEPVEEEPVEEEPAEEEPYTSPIDWDALAQRNPDIYAWLEIPGTNIDYAVLQSDLDDEYYLHLDEDGNYVTQGSLFTQATYNNRDMTDPVTIIYGHHMKSGAMFGNLQQYYSDADTFAEYSDIVIYMPTQELHYTACAAVPYDNRHILYSYNDCQDEDSFHEFWESISSVRAISAQFNEDIDVSYGDHLLVLSTCLAGDNTHRYLVIGRLDEENSVLDADLFGAGTASLPEDPEIY